MSEQNKSECCSTTSGKAGCCCGKKAVIGVIFAILLFSAGYLVAKANLCSSGGMKICPMSIQK